MPFFIGKRASRQNENYYSLLRRSENESLPELIEVKALAFFQFRADLNTNQHWGASRRRRFVCGLVCIRVHCRCRTTIALAGQLPLRLAAG
jgi:hypothetical protein